MAELPRENRLLARTSSSNAQASNGTRTPTTDELTKAKFKSLKQSLVQTGEKMKQSLKKGIESLGVDEDFDHDPSNPTDSPMITPNTAASLGEQKFDLPNGAPPPSTSPEELKAMEASRSEKFAKLLEDPEVDLAKIRKLCWSSIPAQHRPLYWPVLIVSF
jgi:hypothetical protein